MNLEPSSISSEPSLSTQVGVATLTPPPSGARKDDSISGNADKFLENLRREGCLPRIGPVRVMAKISSGGMGVVYRGWHENLHINVAVKFLFPHLALQNPDYVLRFQREARLAAQVNNENLVRVFEVDSQQDFHYVIMELVDGETAQMRVLRNGPLAESEALEIVLKATVGLEAAHRKGIVHRDIKPSNILIDGHGVVKLADLGIAKVMDDVAGADSDLTRPGAVLGTPNYMPPEQLSNLSTAGFPADIYSMGATLFYLLTGQSPHGTGTTSIHETISHSEFPDLASFKRSDVSATTIAIIKNCMKLDPKERFPTATALRGELELAVKELGIAPPVAKEWSPSPALPQGAATVPVSRQKRWIVIRPGIRLPHPSQLRDFKWTRRSIVGVSILGAAILLLSWWVATPARTVEAQSLATTVAAISTPASARTVEARTVSSPPSPETRSSPPVLDDASSATVRNAEAFRRRDELLRRVRELMAIQDYSSAINIFSAVKDWGSVAPEAAGLQIRTLLCWKPSHEREALALLHRLCDGRGREEECETAFQAALSQAQLLPSQKAHVSAWDARLSFLSALATIPSSQAVSKALGALIQSTADGYAAAAIEDARAYLEKDDSRSARALLEKSRQVLSTHVEFARRARERLQEGLKEVETAEEAATDWTALTAALSRETPEVLKGELSQLETRVERIDAFLSAHPTGVHATKASTLRKEISRSIDQLRNGTPADATGKGP